VMNRLLKAGCAVYWLAKPEVVEGRDFGSGAIWVPASAAARKILEAAAKQLGVAAYGLPKAPAAEALKLRPIRIGLYDQYGGLMTSGWIRWLFEQYEFPFEVVYPQTLDAGDLRARFETLVFSDGAFRRGAEAAGRQPKPEEIPAEFRAWLGHVTEEKTIPQIRKFLAAGGSVASIGSATAMAELLGVPLESPCRATSTMFPGRFSKFTSITATLSLTACRRRPMCFLTTVLYSIYCPRRRCSILSRWPGSRAPTRW
jgi:hypothetical protein